jgi:hypothetical protein
MSVNWSVVCSYRMDEVQFVKHTPWQVLRANILLSVATVLPYLMLFYTAISGESPSS